MQPPRPGQQDDHGQPTQGRVAPGVRPQPLGRRAALRLAGRRQEGDSSDDGIDGQQPARRQAQRLRRLRNARQPLDDCDGVGQEEPRRQPHQPPGRGQGQPGQQRQPAGQHHRRLRRQDEEVGRQAGQ